MFLNKIILKDFQAHEESMFVLSPSMNIISGESGVGKTSLVRALEFIFYGGRFRDEYVRHGAKFCSIELYYDSGVVIKRQKGKKVNKYILERPGYAAEVYENFGQEIPAEIKKSLGVQEIIVDSGKSIRLNLISQFEPLFLFTESGSNRIKILGLLAKLNTLDMCLRDLNKDTRNLEIKSKDTKARILSLESDLEQYKDLPQKEALVAQLGGLISDLQVNSDLKANLEDLWARNTQITQEIGQISGYLGVMGQCDLQGLEALLDRYSELFSISQKYASVVDDLRASVDGLGSLSGIKVGDMESNLNKYLELKRINDNLVSTSLELQSSLKALDDFSILDFPGMLGDLDRLVRYNKIYGEYESIIKDLNQVEIGSHDCDTDLSDQKAKYRKGLLELGKCPTCGGDITEDLIAKHMEEI